MSFIIFGTIDLRGLKSENDTIYVLTQCYGAKPVCSWLSQISVRLKATQAVGSTARMVSDTQILL